MQSVVTTTLQHVARAVTSIKTVHEHRSWVLMTCPTSGLSIYAKNCFTFAPVDGHMIDWFCNGKYESAARWYKTKCHSTLRHRRELMTSVLCALPTSTVEDAVSLADNGTEDYGNNERHHSHVIRLHDCCRRQETCLQTGLASTKQHFYR